MPIETMFDESEIEAIRREVAGLKTEFEEKTIPKNHRKYFSELAKRYRIATRVHRQVELLGVFRLNNGDLTTNREIAELFGVDYTAVTLYLKQHLPQQIYSDRVNLCLREGGRRRGENGKTLDRNAQYRKNGETDRKSS